MGVPLLPLLFSFFDIGACELLYRSLLYSLISEDWLWISISDFLQSVDLEMTICHGCY